MNDNTIIKPACHGLPEHRMPAELQQRYLSAINNRLMQATREGINIVSGKRRVTDYGVTVYFNGISQNIGHVSVDSEGVSFDYDGGIKGALVVIKEIAAELNYLHYQWQEAEETAALDNEVRQAERDLEQYAEQVDGTVYPGNNPDGVNTFRDPDGAALPPVSGQQDVDNGDGVGVDSGGGSGEGVPDTASLRVLTLQETADTGAGEAGPADTEQGADGVGAAPAAESGPESAEAPASERLKDAMTRPAGNPQA